MRWGRQKGAAVGDAGLWETTSNGTRPDRVRKTAAQAGEGCKGDLYNSRSSLRLQGAQLVVAYPLSSCPVRVANMRDSVPGSAATISCTAARLLPVSLLRDGIIPSPLSSYLRVWCEHAQWHASLVTQAVVSPPVGIIWRYPRHSYTPHFKHEPEIGQVLGQTTFTTAKCADHPSRRFSYLGDMVNQPGYGRPEREAF